MKILLTNDDGIHYEGLWALYRCLREHHAVEVIAPDRERSAIGHAITLNEPIRLERLTVNGGYQGYAVSGTPADCVKLAVMELLQDKPDMVIAGINPGANVGININYSGTVAAAKEAALLGMPAVAVSVDGKRTLHYGEAAVFVRKLSEKVHREGLPPGTFLNVNIPDMPLAETSGVRFIRQGLLNSAEYFERRVDPRNRTYYWQGCDMQRFDHHPQVDGNALGKNYITVTPIKCDMTDYHTLKTLCDWRIDT